LLLNTDMVFEPAEQALLKLVRFMRSQPQCGLCGCRLYHPNGTYAYPARRFQTLKVIAARRGGLSRLYERELREHFYLDRSCHDSFDCDWLSGCLLMLRREAVQQVGPFDTGFSKYFEDVDMCFRMARAGWRVMFHGETFAYHCEQRASRRLFSKDAWRHLTSYLRWIGKWGFSPHRQIPPTRPYRQAA
jgi:GT2 family glycosyltransferase